MPSNHTHGEAAPRQVDRREFLKHVGAMGLGLASADLSRSQAVKRGGARHFTILHISDIHA